MQFTSYGFILFLALMFAAYFLAPKKWQWVTLLVGSYIFYAFAGVECLVFIGFTTLSSYVISRLMERALNRENDYVAAYRDTLSKEER